MITSSPRDSALVAYSAIQTGVRCAETVRTSCGISSSLSSSTAGARCSRSFLLPMMTPTHGSGPSASLRRLIAMDAESFSRLPGVRASCEANVVVRYDVPGAIVTPNRDALHTVVAGAGRRWRHAVEYVRDVVALGHLAEDGAGGRALVGLHRVAASEPAREELLGGE